MLKKRKNMIVETASRILKIESKNHEDKLSNPEVFVIRYPIANISGAVALMILDVLLIIVCRYDLHYVILLLYLTYFYSISTWITVYFLPQNREKRLCVPSLRGTQNSFFPMFCGKMYIFCSIPTFPL